MKALLKLVVNCQSMLCKLKRSVLEYLSILERKSRPDISSSTEMGANEFALKTSFVRLTWRLSFAVACIPIRDVDRQSRVAA